MELLKDVFDVALVVVIAACVLLVCVAVGLQIAHGLVH